MTFAGFKPATREGVSLLIGLSGGTGSGKTYSAMRIAAGLAGGKRFAVIDTESGRAKFYADTFQFDHYDMEPPYSPEAYTEAIKAAEKAGYPVIMVDSMSHEWSGDGGVLDMHEAELDRMAGDNWQKREAVKLAAWSKPKLSHKKMVTKTLLKSRAHLILCFRAEEKIEMVRNEKGKMEIIPKHSITGLDGWMPICEKSLPFELTCSFLLVAGAPGMPRVIKPLEKRYHDAIFPAGALLDEDAGKRLAQWASGASPASAPASASAINADLHIQEIRKATTVEQLQAAFTAAWKASPKDRDRFTEEKDNRKKALTTPTDGLGTQAGSGGQSPAHPPDDDSALQDVLAQVASAKDEDDLALAVDLVRHLPLEHQSIANQRISAKRETISA